MKKIIYISICLLIYSCKKDEPSHAGRYLGESFGGGVVFYIDGTGEHGFIVANVDQSSAIQWYNGSFINTNTFTGEIGKGQPNTSAIVNTQGDGIYAASLCDKLVLEGFSDWFLPSKNEINLLYEQRNLIGSFTNDYYWCSSEYNTQNAWNIYFPFGAPYYANKSSMACVRAIRAF